MSDLNVTKILAIWGAVISSITLGWNLYRDLSNRGKLRVWCYIGKIHSTGSEDFNDYLVWHITNIGKQPIVLTHIGGSFKNQEYSEFMILNKVTLPKTLKPGEYIVEYIPDLECLNKNLKKLSVLDSLNNKYNAPCRQVKKLKNDYKNKLSQKLPK